MTHYPHLDDEVQRDVDEMIRTHADNLRAQLHANKRRRHTNAHHDRRRRRLGIASSSSDDEAFEEEENLEDEAPAALRSSLLRTLTPTAMDFELRLATLP